MKQAYVISYDLGTSGVKVVLIDMDGRILGDATENYPLYTPRIGWAEQDPDLYWSAVCAATKRVLSTTGLDPKDAKGIAFGSQWKGIIPVDEMGKVLHNSIIWLDARAGEQARALNRQFGRELFCDADYWPKLAWLRENQAAAYENAVCIFEANSYMKWKATGVAAVDRTNHFVRSYDPAVQAFYDEFLGYADIDIKKFPPIVEPSAFVGEVTPKAAQEMGLVPGIPVFGGCGDIPAIAIGSGCSASGACHAYFGSSGWVGIMQPHDANSVYICPFDEGNDLFIHGLQAIGLAFNWTIKQFYHAEQEALGEGIYDLVNREVADIPAGSNRLLATPWMYGERPPFFSEKARAVFLNISGTHDRRYMLNAIMEGVCYTLKMCRNAIAERASLPDSINVVGGGACSDHWMQMLSNVLQIPVNVPRFPRHAGAMGTAYCAFIGLGVCRDFAEAAKSICIERTFTPQADTFPEYDKLFGLFGQLYPTLDGLFRALN